MIRPSCFGKSGIRPTTTSRFGRSGRSALACVALAFASCSDRGREPPRQSAPADDARALVATALRYDSTHQGSVERYAQRDGRLVRIPADSAAVPGESTAEVAVLRDSVQRPLRVEVSPLDPGGDASVTYSYFLDADARVRVVDVRGSFFHSECGELLKARRRVVFDVRGDSVGGEETITVGEGQPKKRSECPLPGAMAPPAARAYADLVRAGFAPER